MGYDRPSDEVGCRGAFASKNPGPPKANSRHPELELVTKYPMVSGTHSGPPERDKVINPGSPETYSGHPEWDKVIDPSPPELILGSPEQDQVKEHPTVSGIYSGPPERDKVIDPGSPEINLSPP